jgi:hypothetical protein
VAHAGKLRVACELLQVALDRVRAQVDPADDRPHNRRVIGEREEPARFLEGLASLHGHGTEESHGSLHLLEIGGEPIALERRALRNPGVLRGIVRPEMLVRIEARRGRVGHAEGGSTAEALRDGAGAKVGGSNSTNDTNKKEIWREEPLSLAGVR